MRPATVLASCRLGMFVAIALLACLGDAGAASSRVSVEASSAESSARLRFLWPDRVVAKAGREGDAVVVTLDREIDAKAIGDAAAMLPGWIASIEAKDRQLRLQPQPGQSATVATLPRGVEIKLAGRAVPRPERVHVSAPPPPASTASDELADQDEPTVAGAVPATGSIGDVTIVSGERRQLAQAPVPTDPEAAAAIRRLRLTRARLLMETGDAAGAKAELEALLREVPSSVEVMSALASVESQIGGWRRAVGLYDRALGLNPDDPSLIRAKAELLREHGPRVRLDIDRRQVTDADLQIVSRLSGETVAGPSIVGFALEGDHIDAPVIRRLDGRLEPFKGYRIRGEGYVALDHDEGGVTRLSLIGGTGIVGAAARHTRQIADGTLRLGLILQDPYWEVVDGLVNEARTDRAQVAFEKIIGTSWRVAGRLSAGRYGVKDHSDVAQFIGPAFEAAYTVVQGPPSFTVGYGFDAEYLNGRKVAVDSFGGEYPLLSVVSREVHSAILGLSGSFSQNVRYNTYGGYAYDRLNSSGPFFGADIAYEPYANFEVGLAVSHSLTASRGTDQSVNRIGGYLLWRF